MGQMGDKAHRIRQKHAASALQLQPPRGRVQRRKQLVLYKNIAPGKGVQQAGLAGVCVAN